MRSRWRLGAHTAGPHPTMPTPTLLPLQLLAELEDSIQHSWFKPPNTAAHTQFGPGSEQAYRNRDSDRPKDPAAQAREVLRGRQTEDAGHR